MIWLKNNEVSPSSKTRETYCWADYTCCCGVGTSTGEFHVREVRQRYPAAMTDQTPESDVAYIEPEDGQDEEPTSRPLADKHDD